MKILIFGGTGAMGTPLVELLAKQENDVYVTSRKAREYDRENIHCIVGNAHDMTFVREILKKHYDVLVDFMNYSLSELKERLDLILNSVGQYIFISSCRVFAESKTPITEETPRLLDVCKDKEYLATEEYALAKAREEDLIFASEHKNWTIVRPTVTYNSHRLQLGCYELDEWLGRALRGKPIVFYDDLADKLTSMTYGEDVARGICLLIGNTQALSETVNIASPESKTWGEILNIYKDTLKKSNMKLNLQIVMLPHAEDCEIILGRKWRLKYNRIYNRRFDSSKMDRLSDGKMTYTPIEDGLKKCLNEFLKDGLKRGEINAFSEAYFDTVLHTHTKLSEFSGKKQKVKYLIARYTPYFAYKRIKNR